MIAVVICGEVHSEEPNLPTHSGTIWPSGRHPGAVFIPGLLSPLGEVVKKDKGWACRTLTLLATTFPHLRKPATKDRELTRWHENTQYLDPGSLEMKNVQPAPLAGTWQTLPSPTPGTLLYL